MTLEFSIADLAASGVAVTALGEDLAAAHAAADGRIGAGCAGWQGLSAAALSAAAQRWSADTAALLARIGEHAHALHAVAQALGQAEQRGAAALGGP